MQELNDYLKVAGLVVLAFLITCVGLVCGQNLYRFQLEPQPTPKSPDELLAPLPISQRRCIEEQFTNTHLIHVDIQEDNRFISIGYITSDIVNAALLYVSQDNSCSIIFKDEVAWLQDYHEKGEPYFHKIQRVELTGDKEPEIYIWLDLYNVPRSSGTYHVFYSKQINGLYEPIFYGNLLCRGWSSVEFVETANKDRPKIVMANDVRCDWRGPGKLGTQYTEILLNNEGREIINSWRDEEVKPDFWYRR